MKLVGKISTIALSSITIAGVSAFCSFFTLTKNIQKVEKVKKEKIKWAKARTKPAYQKCVRDRKDEDLCGWLYNGL